MKILSDPSTLLCMGYIELTYCGNWTKAPAVKTPFEMTYRGHDSELVEDFFFVGDRFDGLDDREKSAIRNHTGVIEARLEFDDGRTLAPAKAALGLTRDLMDVGAVGLFIDPSSKIFSPKSVREMSSDEAQVLFHFLVEVYGDEERFYTSGMAAFGLPDVEFLYRPDNRETGQAAVFGMAMKMVCGDFTPVPGSVFKNTESAPIFQIERDETSSDENDMGYWRLVK